LAHSAVKHYFVFIHEGIVTTEHNIPVALTSTHRDIEPFHILNLLTC
jgi:hypothetical protein